MTWHQRLHHYARHYGDILPMLMVLAALVLILLGSVGVDKGLDRCGKSTVATCGKP